MDELSPGDPRWIGPYQLEARPGDLDAVVVFQSQQAAQEGHDGETCTNWSLNYQLVPAAGSSPPYLINQATEAGAGPVAC